MSVGSFEQFPFYQKKQGCQAKPDISRSKYLSILGYGALPHRPTKGLSGRPLETFGRMSFVLFLKHQVYWFNSLFFI